MNRGKKNRLGKLLMTVTSLTAVLVAAAAGQLSSWRWIVAPPRPDALLARLHSQPQLGPAVLAALPRNRPGISLLLQLLSAPEGKLAKAARREILTRLDELLTSQSTERHDALAVCVATELEQQARQARLPLGATDDLVARLLRYPPADPAQRATLAAHCARALQITAEKHRTQSGAARITPTAASTGRSAASSVRHIGSVSASFPT